MVEQTAKMQVIFPKLEKEFFIILTERILKNKFTEQRLKDSISYLIDNFKYQTPSIADIINFDKKVKLYSYNEILMLISRDEARFEDFHKHWVGDVLYRVRKSDVEMYNLEPYLKQKKDV